MIPNIYHFIYIYGPNTREFDINHFISISSQIRVNSPELVKIYTNDIKRLKSSTWIKILKSSYKGSTVKIVIADITKYDSAIKTITDLDISEVTWMAHRADMYRLIIMYKHGGVYSDVDSIAYSSHENLMTSNVPVFWTERHDSEPASCLCNGYFLAPEKSGILLTWLQRYSTYKSSECIPGTPSWTTYSVQLEWKLYQEFSDQFKVIDDPIQIEPFYLNYNDTESLFFLDRSHVIQTICPYQIHLWETRNRDILKVISDRYFEECNSTYAKLYKKYIC